MSLAKLYFPYLFGADLFSWLRVDLGRIPRCRMRLRLAPKFRRFQPQVGSVDDVRMVKVNFTLNSNPTYSKLPLEESITVKAGTVRCFNAFNTFPFTSPMP